MNNTVEFRAQDGPLLKCRTLDLHLNVGTKVPYIPRIVCYADSTPTSSGKLKARLTSLYRDAESTLTRYQSPTNGRSVLLITLGGLPYIGNRGSLLHLFTPAEGFPFLPRRAIRLPCEEPGAPVLDSAAQVGAARVKDPRPLSASYWLFAKLTLRSLATLLGGGSQSPCPSRVPRAFLPRSSAPLSQPRLWRRLP